MARPIALQLYTVRRFTQTPDDLKRTFAKAKRIGYDAVQISAIGKMDAQFVADALKDEGLACCATHMPLDRLRDDADALIAVHELWGCEYVALGHTDHDTAAGWHGFIDAFNAVADKFAGSGVRLGYHNHSNEMVRYDGRSPLQMMRERFSPDVWLEVDTYWIAHGGGDPAAEIERWAGRVPCVHVKDFSVERGPGGRLEQRMAVVGEGNLNWPRVIDAARAAGTQWFVVEQDECYGQDPFDCAARSLRNVKAMLGMA